jgi:hypothetical protein
MRRDGPATDVLDLGWTVAALTPLHPTTRQAYHSRVRDPHNEPYANRQNAKTQKNAKTVVIANRPQLAVSQLNFCGFQTEVRVTLSRFAGGGPIFFFSAVVVKLKLFSAVVVET